jgi:hypothetical protein
MVRERQRISIHHLYVIRVRESIRVISFGLARPLAADFDGPPLRIQQKVEITGKMGKPGKIVETKKRLGKARNLFGLGKLPLLQQGT